MKKAKAADKQKQKKGIAKDKVENQKQKKGNAKNNTTLLIALTTKIVKITILLTIVVKAVVT